MNSISHLGRTTSHTFEGGARHAGGSSDLLAIANRLRLVPAQPDRQGQRPAPATSALVIARRSERYRGAEFGTLALGVELVVVTVAYEALDHLLRNGRSCVAVFTELDLLGPDDGFDVIAAVAASGYTGPAYLLADEEPLARDRHIAKRRGASGVVLGHAADIRRTLDGALARGTPTGQHPNADEPRRQAALPAWTEPVIQRLATLVGPAAADQVRARYALMSDRYRRAPDPADLVEEVADLLSDWPADKISFVAACSDLHAGCR